MKTLSFSPITLELSRDELAMSISSQAEIRELWAYANDPLHAEYEFQFDFEQTVGITIPESEKLGDRLCQAWKKPDGGRFQFWRRTAQKWTLVFTRRELTAILNSIRTLLEPRSPLLWELSIRSGFHESEFNGFAQQIAEVLDGP